MLRPPPKLFLYSCGWAEVPDHKETISGGLVFDIGDVGIDYENEEQGGRPREASCWQVFGGEGSYLDHVLARTEELKDLLDLLQSLCEHFFARLRSFFHGTRFDCFSNFQLWKASLALASYTIGAMAF